MGNNKKIVAIALNFEHLARFIQQASLIEKQVVIVLSAYMYPSPEMVEFKKNMVLNFVRFCQYEDYLNDDKKNDFFKNLAIACCSTANDFLSSVQNAIEFKKELPPMSIIQQEFQANQVWPLFQHIFIAEQILKTEQPAELWCCAREDWKYTILHPQVVPLTKKFDYHGMEVASLLRMAKLRGVKVRFFEPTVSDRCRYFFTRNLRPILVKAYRQLQLAKTKILAPRKRTRCAQDASPLALAFVRSPVHMSRILPVLAELSNDSWQSFVVKDFSLAVHQGVNFAEHFPVIDLAEYQGWNLYQHKMVVRKLRGWLKKPDEMPPFFYRNIAVADIFREIMLQLADKYSEAASIISAFEKILALHKPSVVLVGNDQELSARCLVDLCAQRGIPTITIQHGLMAMPPLHFIPVVTDKIAVMGKMASDMLKTFGVPPDKIHITGVPGFDSGEISTEHDTVNLSDAGAKAITLITQFWPAFFQEIFPKYLQLAQAMPDETFIIKVAPREPINKYENSLSNVRISSHESLDAVLKKSKIVIGLNSTALIEAMQAGVPTMIVDMFFASDNPMASAAVCLKVDSDWTPIVHKMMYDEEERLTVICRQKKFLSYLLQQKDGAAERIALLVKNCVQVVK